MAVHDDVKATSDDVPPPDWSSVGPEMQADPLGTMAQLRARAPVPYSDAGRLGRGPHWSLMRHADIVDASQDPETFRNVGASRFPHRRPPLESDPPEHGHFRRALQPFFSAARMKELELQVRAFASDLLDPLLASRDGDAARQFARPLPPRALLALLGQPVEDWAQVKAWSEDAYLRARQPTRSGGASRRRTTASGRTAGTSWPTGSGRRAPRSATWSARCWLPARTASCWTRT